jgi:drug/metabolite transporter (DMT)-like permease
LFMSAVVNDTRTQPSPSRVGAGLAFAVVSAFAFGLSGALASPLLDQGWTPGALVLVRIGLAALVMLPVGLHALAGRWHLLRSNARLILGYGVVAVAGAQFCYFSAVSHMDVGPAILIEYTAPAAVVVWMWLRHGQRPGQITLAGAVLAILGLVLVLDLVSGTSLSVPGTAWALAAMLGAATYFIISADETNGVPPLVLATAGLVVGSLTLAALALVGLMPIGGSAASVEYADVTFSWLVPMVLLGLVTAALAYTTGIAAARRLASRLASFVALLEVLAGVLFAWVLLDQLPGALQFAGGALVLAGVVVVKLGEPRVAGTSVEDGGPAGGL